MPAFSTAARGFSFRTSAHGLECRFGAEIRHLHACLSAFRDFASQGRAVQGWQTAEVAIREVLLNAMEHGSAWRSDALIRFQALRLAAFRFRITVEDEGDGFKPPNLSAAFRASGFNMGRVDEGKGESKRVGGLGLAFAHAEEISFGPRGNPVNLLVKISPRMEVAMIPGNDGIVLRPDGALQAEGASAMREALREAWQSFPAALELDFSAVEFIDSASLSVLAVFGWQARETRPRIPVRIVGAAISVRRALQAARLGDLYLLSEQVRP